MLLRTTNPIRLLQIATGFFSAFLLLYGLFSFNSDNIPSRLSVHNDSPPPPTAANSTLDFGAILYVSMPSRTDRQDALSLIAAVTGIELILIPGVDGDSISHKAEPAGTDPELRGSRLGCWRAHVNAWRYIIDNNLDSALILEDDIDWDMNIKEIMGLWNWQLKYNNTIRFPHDVKAGWKEKCPYGCDWDSLFMGQCANTPNPATPSLMTTYTDPHGPDLAATLPTFQKELSMKFNFTAPIPDRLRVTSPVYSPLCTQGYALSRRGAMRMLYHNAYLGLSGPVDNAIAQKTREGKIGGYTMTPPAFSKWRVGGGKDSDIDGDGEKASKGNAEGQSWGLRKSARKSLGEELGQNVWEELGERHKKAKEGVGEPGKAWA